MSTDLATLKNQLPDDIRASVSAQVIEDINRLGSAGGRDTIRVTQDKRFELPNGDIADSIDVVIVDFVYRNEYYIGVYNKKVQSPPACFAISPVAADLEPSESSPMMQSTSGCHACQQNLFGSDPAGNGKACKNTVYLAVLPADADNDTPVWVIKTSPTAVRPFNAYVSKVARSAGIPVDAVVTTLYFDPSSSYASLRFDTAGVNPVYTLTRSRKEEARARLLQEPDVSGFEPPKTR